MIIRILSTLLSLIVAGLLLWAFFVIGAVVLLIALIVTPFVLWYLRRKISTLNSHVRSDDHFDDTFSEEITIVEGEYEEVKDPLPPITKDSSV